MAAVLACGEGTVVSHRSAATLWGLLPDAPGRIDVTVCCATGRSHPAVVAHRSAAPAEEVTTCRGVPCTSIARTLIDLAAVVDDRALERAVDRAEELRAFDLSAVEKAIARNRGRRGVGRLRRVIAQYTGATATQSEAEERLLAALERSGLPKPELNAWIVLDGVTAYRADFLWRATGLVVEVDGRTYHAKRRTFRSDRQRDRRLALAGFETRRYDAGEVFEAPTTVTAEIGAFLSASVIDRQDQRLPIRQRDRPSSSGHIP
jgi:very-short-patch-repair endonuclease